MLRDNNSGGHRELELKTLQADVAFIKDAVVQIMDELAALRRFVRGEKEEKEGTKRRKRRSNKNKRRREGDKQQARRSEAS